MFRELQSEDGGKILYIAPNELLCRSIFANWKRRLQHELGLNIAMLDASQNFAQQSQAIQAADIIMATTAVWETVSRRWRQRKVLHQITLVIFD
jgi:pre-mRNA-splicing helicase BRR2